MSSPPVASVCNKSYELALLLIFVVVVTVLIVAVVDIDADVGRTGTRSKSICSFIGAWVLEVVPYVVVIACGAFLADDRPLAVADNVTDTISLTGTDIFHHCQKYCWYYFYHTLLPFYLARMILLLDEGP